MTVASAPEVVASLDWHGRAYWAPHALKADGMVFLCVDIIYPKTGQNYSCGEGATDPFRQGMGLGRLETRWGQFFATPLRGPKFSSSLSHLLESPLISVCGRFEDFARLNIEDGRDWENKAEFNEADIERVDDLGASSIAQLRGRPSSRGTLARQHHA
nr:hypothetical protein [Mesorhizobium loti]